MKILHVIDSLGRGGAESLIIGLSREMKSRGHDVAIVTLTRRNDFEGLTSLYGIDVYSCNFSGTIRSLPALLRTLLELRTIVRRFQPDVINTHIFFSDVLTRLLLGWRVAVVTTFHRNEDWWSIPASHSARLKRWLEAISARALSRRFIAVSRLAHDEAVRYLAVDSQRCIVVRNGVDTLRFAPADASSGVQDFPVIIQVARFYPEKCHEVSLQAFGILLQTYPGARLWLVGDGPQRGSMEALAQQLGIHERVNFLGLRDDVDDLLRDCQLFWLSSRLEGLPISLLEAMAAGVVPVVTRTGDIPSLIEHGSNGFIVDVGDAEAMARTSASVLEVGHTRHAVARQARRTVEHHYTIASTAQNYLDVYSHALGVH